MNVNARFGRMHGQSRLLKGDCSRRVRSLPRLLCFGALLGLLLLSAACNSTTILQANFDSDNVGSPPAPNQAVGTVSIEPGTVVVVASPATDIPSSKWARFTQPTTPSQQTTLRGNFAGSSGAGDYTLTATLFIPSGSGAVSVSFEGQGVGSLPPGFLHVDFMPEGNVRVDDDENKRFGHFPRDKPFILSVHLTITSTDIKANISLSGADASGSFDTTVNPNFLMVASQFHTVKFFMGFPWQGLFFAENIVVTRKN
jgi:hypothetical protein